MAVIGGGVISDVFSFVLALLFCKNTVKKMKKQRSKDRSSLTARVLGITLPVSFSSFLRSSLVALEHILIPKGLKKSGADYLLLTGETAAGKFPVEAMEYFARIAANGWEDAEI